MRLRATTLTTTSAPLSGGSTWATSRTLSAAHRPGPTSSAFPRSAALCAGVAHGWAAPVSAFGLAGHV